MVRNVVRGAHYHQREQVEDEHIEHISPAFVMNLMMLNIVDGEVRRVAQEAHAPKKDQDIEVCGQVWIWMTNRGAIGLRNDQSTSPGRRFQFQFQFPRICGFATAGE
jgi:hypothetical protein